MKIWNRPFKLLSEIYYKKLDDVNSYTIDNVRIRYSANNDAKAYAYGLDLRLNGEFVPGTESWFSLGYLKTEENLNNQGFIARPTDQRLKFGILFQDYVPNIPDLKGIACSKGSACQSGSDLGSHVLKEVLTKNDLNNVSIRFSLSIYNTKEQIDIVVDEINNLLG
jgi:hypothetical protein